jgi:hypothetical protein
MSFIIDQEFSFNTNAELKKYKKDELIHSKGSHIVQKIFREFSFGATEESSG